MFFADNTLIIGSETFSNLLINLSLSLLPLELTVTDANALLVGCSNISIVLTSVAFAN